MRFALLTFLVVFVLLASGALLLFYRQAMLERISEVVTRRPKRAPLSGSIQQAGASFSGAVGQLERLLPKSQSEISVSQQRLIRAGYRGESTIKTFYGSKILVPLSLCAFVAISGIGRDNPFIMYAVALGLGYLAPDFWLGRKITARQAAIRRGLPDALDLLVICIEAGQSIDQATARAAEELRNVQPQVADELGIVVLEQRAGRPRSESWKHFAERSGVEAVRSLVSVLLQSEQFGTSASKSLRIHSDTLRTQRRQHVEEQAAKTTVKLVFPLVFFIFPSLFVVTLGPAMITIMQNFHTFFNN